MAENQYRMIQPVSTGVSLWRYMDLAKYISLLKDKRLFFSSAATMEDKFEGSISEVHKQEHAEFFRMHSAGQIQDSAIQSTPAHILASVLNIPLQQNAQDRHDVYINCWHNSEHESVAMWKIYAQAGGSVSIKTTYEKLSLALPQSCAMGMVSYKDYASENFGNAFFGAFMHKRKEYEYEREVRALVWSKSNASAPGGNSEINEAMRPGGLAMKADPSNFVEAVVASPFAPAWFFDVLVDVSDRYGLTAPVQRSSLSAQPLIGPL